MRFIKWLRTLPVAWLRKFIIRFTPVLLVVIITHAWLKSQRYLRNLSDKQLASAQAMSHPSPKSDPVVQAFLSRHSVYLSLTSIPERIRYVHEILGSIDLSLVDKVIINLPKKCNRSSAQYTIPKQLYTMKKVVIHWLEDDFGPVSKILPTLEHLAGKDSSSVMIVIDDDVIYPRGVVHAHIQALAHFPKRVTTTMPGKLLQDHAEPPFSYQLDKSMDLSILNGVHSIIHGTGSYGFIAKNIDIEWLSGVMRKVKRQHINDCILSDDLMISIALSRRNTDTFLVANNTLAHALLKPHPLASQHNPLSRTMLSWWLDPMMKRGPLYLTQLRINKCLNYISQLKGMETEN